MERKNFAREQKEFSREVTQKYCVALPYNLCVPSYARKVDCMILQSSAFPHKKLARDAKLLRFLANF